MYYGYHKEINCTGSLPTRESMSSHCIRENMMRLKTTRQERKGKMRMGKEKEQNERMGGDNMEEHGEIGNHMCPVEVTTSLQVLIMS